MPRSVRSTIARGRGNSTSIGTICSSRTAIARAVTWIDRYSP